MGIPMDPTLEKELRLKYDMMTAAWKATLMLYQKPSLSDEDWAEYLFVLEKKYEIEELPPEEKGFLQDLNFLLNNQAERIYKVRELTKKRKLSRQEREIMQL